MRASFGYTLIVILLLVGVEHYLGWSKLLEPWTGAAPAAIVTAALLVLGSYFFRAVRIFRFFPDCGAFPAYARLFLLHNVSKNLLPMQSGEVSFPILMKRYFRMPVKRSVSGLLWMRYLDLHTLLLIGLFSVGLHDSWSWLMLLVPIWVVIPSLTIHLWCSWDSEHKPLDNKLTTWLKQSLSAVPKSPSLLLESWGWTVVNWGTKIAAFAWILTLFASTDYSASLLGAAGGELSSALPVNAPAGVGTYEAGVVAGLAPQGISLRDAVSGGVNLHLFAIGMSILGALLTFLLPRPRRQTQVAIRA